MQTLCCPESFFLHFQRLFLIDVVHKTLDALA